MRIAPILVAVLAAAAAQSYSSNSFTDVLETATDVVVADALDGGVRLQVVRSLQGRYVPGDRVDLMWRDKPQPTPPERGIWFLRRDPNGAVEPLPSGVDAGFRRFYVPAAETPRYCDNLAPVERKIACELAPLLEEIATHEADRLLVVNTAPNRSLSETRRKYYGVLMPFLALPATATNDIYAEFSARPEPFLKALGIAGRLRNGDAAALLALEFHLPTVGPILQIGAVPLSLGGMDLKQNLPAARILARLLIGEPRLPGLEFSGPMLLAATGSTEFVPYYMVLLESRMDAPRGMALAALCQTVRGAEHAAACPGRYPIQDTAVEQAAIQHWKAWWETMPDHASVRAAVPPELRFLTALVHGRGLLPLQLTPRDRAVWTAIATATTAKLDDIDRRARDESQFKQLEGERTAILKAALDDLRRGLSPAGRQVLEEAVK